MVSCGPVTIRATTPYRVMTDREQWFRVVMGQDAVARLITHDSPDITPLPSAVSDELNFKLAL